MKKKVIIWDKKEADEGLGENETINTMKLLTLGIGKLYY